VPLAGHFRSAMFVCLAQGGPKQVCGLELKAIKVSHESPGTIDSTNSVNAVFDNQAQERSNHAHYLRSAAPGVSRGALVRSRRLALYPIF